MSEFPPSPTPTPKRRRLVDRPASYEEMKLRPNFREVLDQKEHKLKEVLTDYHFPKLVPCGLSHCKTPHRPGFLVATVDGLETNVGHVCGRVFGDSFDIARAEYQRAREFQDLLDRAAQICEDAASVRARVHALDKARYGTTWIGQVRAALYAVLGTDLFDSLRVAQLRGQLQVKEYRRRSRAEIDNIVEMTRQKREQVQTEETLAGTLASMPWITYDFTKKLHVGLLKPLSDFEWKDHDQFALAALRRDVKQFDGWHETVSEAEQACTEAVRFFEPENLALLVRWVPERMNKYRLAVSAWASSEECRKLALGNVT